METIAIDSAAIRLTDTILGYNEEDLEETLRSIAAEIGIAHIAYMRFSPEKSSDTSLLTANVTYSIAWQNRYFEKQYVLIDPVITRGADAVAPFDWTELASDDPRVQAFFADAFNHGVGVNGVSIPVRSRRGAFSLVSFSSNLADEEWSEYRRHNMAKLQIMAVLIDSAASINLKLNLPPVKLSKRE